MTSGSGIDDGKISSKDCQNSQQPMYLLKCLLLLIKEIKKRRKRRQHFMGDGTEVPKRKLRSNSTPAHKSCIHQY